MSERLTDRFVKSVTKPGRYRDGGGLLLQVGRTGGRSWLYQYRDRGRRPELGLGPYPTVSLREARQKVLALRKARLDGQDILDERRKARASKSAAVTFRWAAERFIAAHEAGWRGGDNAKQWIASLSSYAFPTIGRMSVRNIDTEHVMLILDPIWRRAPQTASRVRQRIERVLDWAGSHRYREGGDNPARWRGHLENLLPAPGKVRAKEHYPALPIDEVPVFLQAIRTRRAVSARAVEFLTLTAARTGEVIAAKWDEVDFAEKLWVVPAERTKAAREHRVPLPPQAIAVLERMASVRQGEFVFPGRAGPLKESAMRMLLHDIGYGDYTIHGLRSSFRDWVAERTAFDRDVAEAALAHVVGNATEAAYRRGSMLAKRRRLMEAWGEFCLSPPTTGEAVVAIGNWR